MKKIISKLGSFILIIIISQINKGYTNDNKSKIIINIPSKRLELINNGKLIKGYPVGVGTINNPTPIGNFFKVISKVENPMWQNPYKSFSGYVVKPGVKCPIGTRWIGFYLYKSGEYGIHGTNEPSSVGKYSSHGCIRMKKQDVEELFDKVEIGTPVIINNYCYKLENINDKLKIKRYPTLYPNKVSIENMINRQLEYYGKEKIPENDFPSEIKNIKEGIFIELKYEPNELILKEKIIRD